MFATINTKNGPIYVQKYYSNAHVVRVTLTADKNKQNRFSGERYSGHEYEYGHGPNYKPLMAVRDILRSKEMSYIGYKSINLELINPLTNEHRGGKLPSHTEKYKGIGGKKVTVVDDANNVVTTFVAEKKR